MVKYNSYKDIDAAGAAFQWSFPLRGPLPFSGANAIRKAAHAATILYQKFKLRASLR